MSDDGGVPDAEPVGDQGVHVPGQGGLVVAGRPTGAVPQAGQVDRVDGVVFGECRHDRPPAVPGLGPAVYQHHRAAAATGDVVHANTVDVGESVPEDVPESRVVVGGHGMRGDVVDGRRG